MVADIRSRLHSSLPLAGILLVVAGLVVAGLATLGAAGPPATAMGGGVPWPATIAPIAAFVSHDRGLAFLRPVPVHFQAPRVFDAQVAKETAPSSAATRAADRQYASQLRALGLLAGSVNLVAAETAADASGGVLGYYTPTTKAVYLRGRTLTPAVRVTLAHELTHALQDQHFGLNRLDQAAVTDGQQFGLTALEEGDAVLDEDDYQDSLSPAQQRQATRQPTTSTTGTPFVPILTVTASVPYVLGPDLVNALYAVGGNAAVNAAYRRPPGTELDVVNPADYLARTPTRSLPAPAVPTGDHREGAPQQLGAFTLYLTLADRLPARTALAVADDWGGGSMVQYRTTTGRSCLAADLTGRSGAGTAQMAAALTTWAAAMPAGLASTGPSAGGTIGLTACDPGRAARPGAHTLETALTLVAERDQNEVDALYAGASATVADCVGNRALTDRTLLKAEAASSASRKVTARVGQLVRACAPRHA